MKFRLIAIAVLALIMTFGTVSSGLYAADSISAYLGFSREVNEALAGRIQEKTGVEGDLLSTVGYGEFRPLTSNETLEGRAQNRRIEIVLVPKDLRQVPKDIK